MHVTAYARKKQARLWLPARLKRAIYLTLVVLFGFIGYKIYFESHAAVPTASFEVEKGQLAGTASQITDTTASNGQAVKFGSTSSGAILFQDDFNGATGSMVDATKWHEYSACGYRSSAAYGDIQCGEDERLDGQGHLIIPATPTRGQGLMTGANFEFTYGTISAWIKMPPQVGYWPAFWTVNDPPDGKSNPPAVGEIDVSEAYTTWPTMYHSVVHNWNTNNALASGGGLGSIETNTDLSAAFHKYTAKIEPNKITFYFDDKQMGQPFTPDLYPGKPWAFGPNVTNQNWLILTLAVGGADGQQTPATQNAQMLVDRVEVKSN